MMYEAPKFVLITVKVGETDEDFFDDEKRATATQDAERLVKENIQDFRIMNRNDFSATISGYVSAARYEELQRFVQDHNLGEAGEDPGTVGASASVPERA